jgi:hypothetical protein
MTEDYDALKRENADLREKLARATAEAEKYRASTRELLEELFPDAPTEDELRAAMVPDEDGESLTQILDRFRSRMAG